MAVLAKIRFADNGLSALILIGKSIKEKTKMGNIVKSNYKKISTVIMAFVLVFTVMISYTLVGAAEEGWTEIDLKDPNLYYLGRTSELTDGVGFDWSSSGVTLNVKASDVRMTFTAQTGSNGTQGNRAYFWVYTNGVKANEKLLLKDGKNTYDIATGLDATKTTEIRVIKATEANFSYANLNGISVKGSLEPIAHKDFKIEVIGDSISAGQWLFAQPDARVFKADEEDSTYTYGSLLADKFDAEFTLLASSGSGIFMDSSGLKSGETKNGKAANIWSDMYDYSVTSRSQRGSTFNTNTLWDFSNDNPDLIIVNLGTNDSANVARIPDNELNAGVTNGVKSFLSKLTEKHPNAKIVWCYGIMNQNLTSVIKNAVDGFASENSSTNVSFVELPLQSEFSSTTGGGNHPNTETHSKLADYLVDKIGAEYREETHSQVEYTVPVLSTNSITGNTIFSLDESNKNWNKYFVSPPSNIENNAGIHYEWSAAAGNSVQNGIDSKFYFDGLSVKLANIGDSQNHGSRRFALILGDTRTKYYTNPGVLRIKFDGYKNTVSADLPGVTYDVITDADIFEAMPNNEVYIDIKKAENKTDYSLTVTAGDKIASGIIQADKLSDFALDANGKCYVSLSAVNITGQKPTNIDFLGVGSTLAKTVEYRELHYSNNGTITPTNGTPLGGSYRYYYNSTTSASCEGKATVRAAYGLGKGTFVSVNGFILNLAGKDSTLNGEPISVVENDLNIYDIALKVEQVFGDRIYNTLITAEINGVAYSVKSVKPAKKTLEGVEFDNSRARKYLIILPTDTVELNNENCGYRIDKSNRVIFVTDKSVETINSNLKTSGTLITTEDGKTTVTDYVKTDMRLRRQSNATPYMLYTLALENDVNSDGNIDITDLVRLKEAKDEDQVLTIAQKCSVGIDKTGVVDENTLNNMRSALLK